MLQLYQFEGCPYSATVREKLSELGISYVIHNPRLGKKDGSEITNQHSYDELVELGGEDQVPYLVDSHRGRSIYNCDDIVEYLETHYD